LEVEHEIGLRWGSLTKWNCAKEELEEIKTNIANEMKELESHANVY
jgi:hypothetical protein